MNGSIRQRSPGTWELTVDVGRDLAGKRRRKYVTVRGLSHFHASVTLQSGQNVVVSERLGHANVSITTDIYAHSLPGWQKQAAEAFAKAMEV